MAESSKSQLGIIVSCNVVGGDLFSEFLLCDHLIDDLKNGNMPRLEDLYGLSRALNYFVFLFDDRYFRVLKDIRPNPLEIEQQAWQLLSKEIHVTLDEYKLLLNKDELSIDILLLSLQKIMDFIDDWKKISNSFKCVEQELDEDFIGNSTREIHELIERLSNE
jgi:hypothetical protein